MHCFSGGDSFSACVWLKHGRILRWLVYLSHLLVNLDWPLFTRCFYVVYAVSAAERQCHVVGGARFSVAVVARILLHDFHYWKTASNQGA